MHRIGLIGVGHWGPNIARSMELTGRARLTWLCDTDGERLAAVGGRYREARTSTEPEELFADPELDAVCVATPVVTHFDLVWRALDAGLHVLVEKPITASSDEAAELVRRAEARERVLMVGHVFHFNASLMALKDLIGSGELGDIHYLNLERTNLGPVRTDVNALWDLASHDVSILCDLMGEAPCEVSAGGRAFLNPGVEDAVFATLAFRGGPLAHVHASWLNPRKVRQITVVGSKKMAIWDDLDLQAPIRIYDRRAQPADDLPDTFLGHKTFIVDGGVFIPHVALNAPLQAECEHFLDGLESGAVARSDAREGLQVVLALEAASESMRNRSVVTPVRSADALLKRGA